jgi:hypothetical protein
MEELLYDSNVHGKWNNGVKRTVTKTEGSQAPNGKGIFIVGKGNPRLVIEGNGTARFKVEGEMNDRFYIRATNFNSVLTYDFRFETSGIKQHSCKLRSRHQELDPCENRLGGWQARIGMDKENSPYNTLSMQLEYCHPVYKPRKSVLLPQRLVLNKWYTMRFTCKNTPDNKAVYCKSELSYKDGVGFRTIAETTDTNLAPYIMDEAIYMKESYIWMRVNTSGGKNTIAYKNIKLKKLNL